MRRLPVRIWVLIIALILSLLAINPNPFAKGVEISHVEEGSTSAQAGVQVGQKILFINRQPIETVSDFNEQIRNLNFDEKTITLETEKDTYAYTSVGSLGFAYNNRTVVKVTNEQLRDLGLAQEESIIAVNQVPISSDEGLQEISQTLFTEEKFIIQTDAGEFAYLITEPPQLRVREARKSNINKGLDLAGGTRVLLQPVSDVPVTDKGISDLIAVLTNRLNVYGLADVQIRSANDFSGNKFVLVEIAGATREEVRELIAQQGKFEAKIGDETIFTGGQGDLPFVCRNDGSCAGIIPPCQKIAEQLYSCQFQFAITLSQEAAERHAAITDNLEVNISSTHQYLSKQLDLYLDGQLVDSLNIAADLKGKAVTKISISGSGTGITETAAYDDAIKQMSKLQTVLITGSLPLKLEILKLDTISPVLGEEFIKNTFVITAAAIIAVLAVLYVCYRRLIVLVYVGITILAELIIILGFAAVSQWNLDVAAIAGIIAVVGTGVDSQIIMLDEGTKGASQANWKERLKNAFRIITMAWFTIAAAMIPLGWVGAGLARGFALTTIAGATIGILITRPAFSAMMENMAKKE